MGEFLTLVWQRDGETDRTVLLPMLAVFVFFANARDRDN
jgi:hypothetical protein